MPDYVKPLPAIDPDTKPFWDGCKAHELRIPRCRSCHRLYFPPQGICSHCLSNDIEWTRASGRGEIYTLTVVHQNKSPGFKDEVPYVVAYVELAEGVQMMSNITGPEATKAKIGDAVEVLFEDATPTVTLPKFRLRK